MAAVGAADCFRPPYRRHALTRVCLLRTRQNRDRWARVRARSVGGVGDGDGPKVNRCATCDGGGARTRLVRDVRVDGAMATY